MATFSVAAFSIAHGERLGDEVERPATQATLQRDLEEASTPGRGGGQDER